MMKQFDFAAGLAIGAVVVDLAAGVGLAFGVVLVKKEEGTETVDRRMKDIGKGEKCYEG